ncbi:MAG: DUF1786 domain-containing protein [Pseudomonadota bacterium]
MKEAILAIDIGGGTQDILLFDPSQPLENAVKLVLPSPTVIAARKIRRASSRGLPVLLTGKVMGGGAVGRAARDHLAAGLAVYSLPGPALTFHDNLDHVRRMGITVVADQAELEKSVGDLNSLFEVRLGDVDLAALTRALAIFEVPLPDLAALAIQDHGFSPGFSNRITRFRQWQDFLDSGGEVERLLFRSPPAGLTRWVAAAEDLPGAFFMDTCAAALRGAVLDDNARECLDSGLVVVNAGNEHTVAFLVKGRRVLGVYEHHTSIIDPGVLADQMDRFARGTLSNKEIFDQGGHGLAYRAEYRDLAPFGPVFVTGPQRDIARGLGGMAAPFGEMMLSGCFGLIEAVREFQASAFNG